MSDLWELADLVIRPSVVVFMVANLLAIGLEIELESVVLPLRNARFVVTVVLLDSVLCPGFAWLIVRFVPMAPAYADGLLLIGLAPAAPFLPLMVRRAGGDLAYTAAFMLIAAIGTVILMPLAVPYIEPGQSVHPWTVAKPLVVLLFVPMAVGMAIKAAASKFAAALGRIARLAASMATVVLLAAIVLRYFRGFVEAVGGYAIAAQFLYAVGLMLAAHAMGAGMPPRQRSVLSLGAGTRNLGAALAPLLVNPPDPRTLVMVALAVPITLVLTYVAAIWLAEPMSTKNPS
jgi:BASS family bile acid:Na+ symporter